MECATRVKPPQDSNSDKNIKKPNIKSYCKSEKSQQIWQIHILFQRRVSSIYFQAFIIKN